MRFFLRNKKNVLKRTVKVHAQLNFATAAATENLESVD